MTPEALDQLEAFFNSVEVPQVILLYPGVTLNDVPNAIKQWINHCRTTKPGLYTTEPRFADLLRLQELLNPQATSEAG
jgi:hypothetical protein